MRILLYSRTFAPALGGLEQAALVLARELSARGHRVVVASDVAAPPGFDAQYNFEVIRGRSFAQLVRFARQADVVHTNGHSMLAHPLAAAARRPLVVTHSGLQAACLAGSGFHDGERCGSVLRTCAHLTAKHRGGVHAARQLIRHAAARLALRQTAEHVAVSAFVQRRIRVPGATVIHNCADTSVFKPRADEPAGDRFLFVGRFVEEKGVELLLRVVARCANRGSPVRLDLVGAGPLEDRLRRLAEELRVVKWVEFRGRLQGEDLASAMRKSLALLVPTLCEEAFGIVAAEAISCGRPALVSNAGGLPEVVDGTECVLPVGDEAAWAETLLRFRAEPLWRSSIEERLPVIARRFTEATFTNSYCEVYERALGNGIVRANTCGPTR